MKTNVTLKSSDRELFGIKIRQDTKNEFLSVTDLQQAYELARWEHGWSERRIEFVTRSIDFRERLYYVLENQGFINTTINAFIQLLENQGFTKAMKELGVWKTTGARGTNQVMCNPYIWVLIALEMNPMIYAKVIVWLTDTLIFNRIEAGTEYLPMNEAISTIVTNPEYYKFATLINIKVFGKHLTGMRNLASAKELRKIADLEKYIVQAINAGFLKNESDIVKAIEMYK